MIYLDSCALVKLVIREDETDAIRTWLSENSTTPRLSSSLVRVELMRTIMRRHPAALLHGRRAVAGVRRIAMTNEVLEVAAMLQPGTLRSLDAIHLASALAVHDQLTAFVSYDHRLLETATTLGLPVTSPA